MPDLLEGVEAIEPIQAEVVQEDPAEGARVQVDPILAQIPDELWDPVKEDIDLFLQQELYLAEGERGNFIKKLARWQVVYDAPMPEKPKHFPIANASDLTIPIAKELVNTLAAQIVQAVTAVRPWWILDDLAHEWAPFKTEIEEFMTISGDRELSLEEHVVEQVFEKTKWGTDVFQIGWNVREKKTWQYKGEKVSRRTKVLKDGPDYFPIPLQKWWIRFHETDLQAARWVAKEFDWTESELKLRAEQGEIFPSELEKILPNPEQSTDRVTDTQEKLEDTEPIRETYKVFEIWLTWPKLGEIVLLYERDKRAFLSRHFSPYLHGLRPFIRDVFIPKKNRFYGTGICEMVEQIQAAISTQHNQRFDNFTLANLAMIIKRKLMKDLKPGDPLYAGKIIEATDIWNDIREFRLSEPYPSTHLEEHSLRQTAERVVGSNEGVAGAAMPVTRTGTGAQLALLQEQAKRIDIPVKGTRRSINEIGMHMLLLYGQFGSNGKAVAWMGGRGKIVEAIFRLPQRVFELGLGISAKSPTSMQNKQYQRESDLALFNLLVQMYEKIAPLAQMMAPEQLPEFVHGMVRSARKYMQTVLERFDQPDPDEVLAGLVVLEKALPRPEDFGGLDAYERGAYSAEVLEGLRRLESISSEAEAAARARVGVADRRRDGTGTPLPEGVSTRDFSNIRIGGELRARGREGVGGFGGGEG